MDCGFNQKSSYCDWKPAVWAVSGYPRSCQIGGSGKAFGMLPAFSFPVAAVPYQPADVLEDSAKTCDQALLKAGIDVEWVLSLFGVVVAHWAL